MGWYNDNLAGYNYNPATNQAPKNTDVSLRGYGHNSPRPMQILFLLPINHTLRMQDGKTKLIQMQ